MRRFGENELGSGEADGVVESAAAADHDDFVLQAGGVGKLPNIFRIAAGHAGSSGGGHGARCAGSDHASFSAGEFSETAAGAMLQFEHVDEIFGGFALGRGDFRKFQRAAEIGPGAAAIDDGFYAEARVDILSGIFAERGGRGSERFLGGNLSEQRRSSGPAKKSSATKLGHERHSRASIE